MPLVNGKEMSPDAAIAAGLCPETGVSLAGLNIKNHIGRIWPNFARHESPSPEAKRRMGLLVQFANGHPDLAPKYDEEGALLPAEEKPDPRDLAIADLQQQVATLHHKVEVLAELGAT